MSYTFVNELKIMIEFIDINDDKKVKRSYEQVAIEFLNSPEGKMRGGFVLNMIFFLDLLEKEKGLKFVRMEGVDWEELYKATVHSGLSKELVA